MPLFLLATVGFIYLNTAAARRRRPAGRPAPRPRLTEPVAGGDPVAQTRHAWNDSPTGCCNWASILDDVTRRQAERTASLLRIRPPARRADARTPTWARVVDGRVGVRPDEAALHSVTRRPGVDIDCGCRCPTPGGRRRCAAGGRWRAARRHRACLAAVRPVRYNTNSDRVRTGTPSQASGGDRRLSRWQRPWTSRYEACIARRRTCRLGSLGSGNHFVERDRRRASERVWLSSSALRRWALSGRRPIAQREIRAIGVDNLLVRRRTRRRTSGRMALSRWGCLALERKLERPPRSWRHGQGRAGMRARPVGRCSTVDSARGRRMCSPDPSERPPRRLGRREDREVREHSRRWSTSPRARAVRP